MSRIFGPATQNGIVVKDLDQALSYWTGSLGVGPFFRIDNLPGEYFFHREVETAPPQMSIALGNWGDLQIELILPKGDGPSTWHEFLHTRGGGLHHVSVWSETYDEAVARALGQGLRVEARGKIAGGPRYAYFQAGGPDQPLLEISELLPQSAALYAMIREAGATWDGRDPVRSF